MNVGTEFTVLGCNQSSASSFVDRSLNQKERIWRSSRRSTQSDHPKSPNLQQSFEPISRQRKFRSLLPFVRPVIRAFLWSGFLVAVSGGITVYYAKTIDLSTGFTIGHILWVYSPVHCFC